MPPASCCPTKPVSYAEPAIDEETAPYNLCEDLFKIYKIANLEVVALRGLDLRVRRRELMAIVGSSGSG